MLHELTREGGDVDHDNRWVLFPIKHPKVWALYKRLQENFWLAEDFLQEKEGEGEGEGEGGEKQYTTFIQHLLEEEADLERSYGYYTLLGELNAKMNNPEAVALLSFLGMKYHVRNEYLLSKRDKTICLSSYDPPVENAFATMALNTTDRFDIKVLALNMIKGNLSRDNLSKLKECFPRAVEKMEIDDKIETEFYELLLVDPTITTTITINF